MNKEDATASATNLPQWLRLAEYGDWPHQRGLQHFTPEAASAMVRHFKSLRGRLARKFGGLPVYIGHPDDAQFSGQSGHTDTRAYAWVTDLQARADGLYAAFRWSTAGQELLCNAFYKFLSPRWAMEAVGKGSFRPVRLLSVGLTNQPNIPGEAIANSQSAVNQATPVKTPAAVAAPLALPTGSAAGASGTTDAETGDTHQDEADAQTHHTGASHFTRQALCDALGVSADIDPLEAIAELREQSDRFYRIACDQNDGRLRHCGSATNQHSEHVELVLQNAVLSGRIAPHQCEHWQQQLERDWDNARTELANQRPQLKTTAIANTRTTATAGANATDFIALVEARARSANQNFAQAWSALKRERPDLFEHFFKSAG